MQGRISGYASGFMSSAIFGRGKESQSKELGPLCNDSRSLFLLAVIEECTISITYTYLVTPPPLFSIVLGHSFVRLSLNVSLDDSRSWEAYYSSTTSRFIQNFIVLV